MAMATTNTLPLTVKDQQIEHYIPLSTIEGERDPHDMLSDVLDENHLYKHALHKANRKLYVLRAQLKMAKQTEEKHTDLLEVIRLEAKPIY